MIFAKYFSPKSILNKTFLLLASFILSSTMVFAQDSSAERTAASAYNEGLALLKEKNYEQGLVFMEEALVKATADNNEKIIGLSQKNGSKACYNLGKTKLKAGAIDEASQLFDRGAELDESYSSNFIGQARVLDQKKMYKEAIDAYFAAAGVASTAGKEKRIADAHKRAKAVVTKLYKAKNYEEVIARGEQYLANNANASVNYYVGKSYMNSKNYEDAVKHLDLAIAGTEGEKDKMIYAKAQSHEKLGNNTEAVETYKKITNEKYKEQADYKISTLK